MMASVMAYESAKQEPPLEEVFADPIVRLLMKTDHVEAGQLSSLLGLASKQIADLLRDVKEAASA